VSWAAIHAEAPRPEASRASSSRPQEELSPDVRVQRVSPAVAGLYAVWWQRAPAVEFRVQVPTR